MTSQNLSMRPEPRQLLPAAVVAGVAQPCALTAEERHQVLVEWNRTEHPWPQDQCVHQLFEQQAARTPDAVAVELHGSHLTYRQLNERANQLAHFLRRRGVKPGCLVGISLERSLEVVVGIYGILKAGGAYVPLDPAYPRERLAYMLEAAQVRVLVMQASVAASFVSTPNVERVKLDQDLPAISLESRENPEPLATPDDLIYVIFTSGSTGRPKGAAVYHRGFTNLMHWFVTEFGITETDRTLLISSLSFDLTQKNLYASLIRGGTLHLYPPGPYDVPLLARLIQERGITLLNCTPSAFYPLVEPPVEQTLRGLGTLRIVFLGGEPISIPRLRPWLTHPTCRAEIANTYGPTECTDICGSYRLSRGNLDRYDFVPLGRPVYNVQLAIVDAALEPCSIGVPGELCVAGTGVGAGYLNDSEMTAAKFVANPFPEIPGTKLYRTGDQARWLPDGVIEFLGRLDHQVKIRGFRIELHEIENVLNAHPAVREAVVIVKDAGGTGTDPRLHCYYTLKNGATVDAAGLRDFVRSRLPEYMAPAAFHALSQFPLSPNGKVDRKALPGAECLNSDEDGDYEAPRGATEEKLAGILASLLQVPRVGRKDSFFDLGGHSILAVTLFNEIERVFGERLPLATLLSAPTIEQMAPVLETKQHQPGNWASLVAIQPRGSKPRFFCIHGAGGNVLLYRDLARHFGEDYPFYGLQSQGLDGKVPPLETVEEMAERYCREVLELQPTGPYYLGGYCLGGTIAYEMARRLRQEGHEVPLVALLDTYNFSRMEQPKLMHYLWQKLTFHLSTLAHLRLKNWPGYFRNKLRVARDGELSSLWKTLVSSFGKKATDPDGSSIETSVQAVNDRAAFAYRPMPYEGRVTLFKPEVNYDFYPDPQMGWGEVAVGGLELVELSANPHAMLVEPFVRELAGELQRRLDAVS